MLMHVTYEQQTRGNVREERALRTPQEFQFSSS
jgi:hypothetical protein